MQPSNSQYTLRILSLLPLVFFVAIVVVFSLLSDSFFTVANARNILLQSSHLAILALGASLVLLVAGVDLSVGAVMYVAAVVIGLHFADSSMLTVALVTFAIGAAAGLINALFIVKLRIAAFIVTLSMMFAARGLGHYLSDTRMVFANGALIDAMQSSVLGIPVPIVLALTAFVLFHVLLTSTPFGREIFAVGGDPEGARRAGIRVDRVYITLYVLCGILAACAGVLLMGQIAATSSTFGERKEFLAIASAVLGGTSLFGGRGSAIGPVSGAILIQTVENGLVMINADPYIYPLVTATVIFLAVLVDTLRNRVTLRLSRRKIRAEELS